jgi:hypothetical protein
MSIDELGRAAAEESLRAAAHRVNAVAMLDELHRRHRMRIAATIAVIAAVCVAAVAGVLLARSGKPNAAPPANNKPHPLSTLAPGCRGGPPVQCRSGRRVLVSLPVPVTIHAPANFNQDARLCGTSGLETYRSDSSGTGVTVIENAVPVRYDRSWHRDRSAGTSLSSMTHWLSSRPFLTHTSVKQVTVDGFAGRQVSGELKVSAELPAPKAPVGFVAPTFAGQGYCDAGYSPGLYGSYTLVDVPGAGVTVIWSWTVESNHALIAGNQALIDGLTFG